MDTAKTIKVIETTLLRMGSGEDKNSPIRIVTQYWTEDGQLLAQNDPAAVTLTPEEIHVINSKLRVGYSTSADVPNEPLTELLPVRGLYPSNNLNPSPADHGP